VSRCCFDFFDTWLGRVVNFASERPGSAILLGVAREIRTKRVRKQKTQIPILPARNPDPRETFAEEFEVVIMIERVTEEMHGSN
jgi:hypothetical protein